MTMGARKRKHQALMKALMEEIKNGLDRAVAAKRGDEIFAECFGDLPRFKQEQKT